MQSAVKCGGRSKTEDEEEVFDFSIEYINPSEWFKQQVRERMSFLKPEQIHEEGDILVLKNLLSQKMKPTSMVGMKGAPLNQYQAVLSIASAIMTEEISHG